MNISHLPYSAVPQLNSKDQDYISLRDYLKDYYEYTPDISSFEKVMSDRDQHPVDRETLYKEVNESYSTIGASSQQSQHIEDLPKENTYTVITAHQPSLFGGPMYYIYKICSAINLSRQLKIAYPDKNVIPVFINGSEDHDFDEIDHLNIYGKTISWDRQATGAVGRLDLNGLSEVIDTVSAILGEGEHIDSIMAIMREALSHATNYNDFVFRWVNKLFASYGLLVINTDNKALKRNFIPILRKEITERPSQEIILETQRKLDEKGFKSQAYPRDINLFYLGYGDRQRITYEDGKYHVVDTSNYWTELEILAELDAHPEHFSPNVVMRPLYQEYTLPNLAYIGGGGEIAYWLERKAQFRHFGVMYPMLIRRNSVMILDKSNQGHLTKLGLDVEDIFDHEDQVINKYLLESVSEDITINEELSAIESAYRNIADKAAPHDPGLEKAVLAEMTKQLKSVDNLGSRIKRAIKTKEENNVNKIRKVKDKLFPNMGLQERKDNFLQYYAKHGPSLIEYLVANLDPLLREFAIIRT